MGRRGGAGALTLILALAATDATPDVTERPRASSIGESPTTASFATREPEPDAVSARCLGCHGADAGGAIAATAAGGQWSGVLHGRENHPIGTAYGELVRRRPASYKPPRSLPGDVRLVDGRVSCASCHTLDATSAGHDAARAGARDACLATGELAARDAAGGLCTACHSL